MNQTSPAAEPTGAARRPSIEPSTGSGPAAAARRTHSGRHGPLPRRARASPHDRNNSQRDRGRGRRVSRRRSGCDRPEIYMAFVRGCGPARTRNTNCDNSPRSVREKRKAYRPRQSSSTSQTRLAKFGEIARSFTAVRRRDTRIGALPLREKARLPDLRPAETARGSALARAPGASRCRPPTSEEQQR